MRAFARQNVRVKHETLQERVRIPEAHRRAWGAAPRCRIEAWGGLWREGDVDRDLSAMAVAAALFGSVGADAQTVVLVRHAEKAASPTGGSGADAGRRGSGGGAGRQAQPIGAAHRKGYCVPIFPPPGSRPRARCALRRPVSDVVEVEHGIASTTRRQIQIQVSC